MVKRSKSESNTNQSTSFEDEIATSSTAKNTNTPEEDDPNAPEIVLSNKGGPKLIHRGFMYTLHKKQPHNIRWRCVGRTTHCRGSLITSPTCSKPRVRSEHNHKPDFAAAQVARKRYLALGKPRILPGEALRKTLAAASRNDDESPEQPQRSKTRATPRNRNRNSGTTAAAVAAAGATGARLILVSTDTTKLPNRRNKHEENTRLEMDDKELQEDIPQGTKKDQRSGKQLAPVKENIVESIRLEDLAMKQEPEDEEDCYLEEGEFQVPDNSTNPANSPNSRHATHRVRSHARSLRAMANPSAVWAHFDLCANDPLRAQCRICGAVVVRGGANPRQCGTTNLHRHLRVHHGGRLIGRRYHVLQSGQSSAAGKTIRIAAQSLMRSHVRNIAPSGTSQQLQSQIQSQSLSQSTSQPQLQAQPQRQPKTLVLKTIPLKVKQVAPTTIKMAPRQASQAVPQNILHQQPTEVCLRWNSYHSNMQSSFPSLLDTEQFVDVTLACEGRSLKCHKMILSSCSDYLAELLRENPCQHPIILMKDLKFWEVEALVKFMYRGEVNVAHDKLPQLLNAAEALQVKGLAGPTPSAQGSKPPLLIPQTKPLVQQPIVPRLASETKESKATSSTSTVSSSPKRAQKRQQSEPIDPKPFTKIRLQRPPTPTSPLPIIKMEPLDSPLSPNEIFPDNHEDSSNPSHFEKMISLHEEDDPGGNEMNDVDTEMNFCEMPGPPDINDTEDQMEFVPSDFLEQEQDIVEESDILSSKDIRDDSREGTPVELEIDTSTGRNGMDKEQVSKERKPV